MVALFQLQKVAFYLFVIVLDISLFNIEIDGIYTWKLKQRDVLRSLIHQNAHHNLYKTYERKINEGHIRRIMF